MGNVRLAIALLLCASPAMPQASKPDLLPSTGVINGRIVNDNGAAIAGAKVTLSHDGSSPSIKALARADGRFSFPNVPAGPFRLAVSASGFAAQTMSGALESGDVSNLPPIRMTLALSAVEVTPTRVGLAEQQNKEQEQQRVLGVLPNFFATYDPDALPLNARQKFELSWKSRVDPVLFSGTLCPAP
jgi:hypothetical protein